MGCCEWRDPSYGLQRIRNLVLCLADHVAYYGRNAFFTGFIGCCTGHRFTAGFIRFIIALSTLGPWSGLSMHPVESMLYMSSVLVFFLIPAHPIIVLLHLYIRAIGPCFTHAGFENAMVGEQKLVDAGDFHHQVAPPLF